MGEPVCRTVVVSSVNLRKGGTLTILRQCLTHLSAQPDVRTIALVHDRKLCEYPGVEYIEIPWTVKSWALRLWCEYVTMHRISRRLAERFGEPVDVWLSLHDTTPRVMAKKQEVYCHTSFPFLKLIPRDWRMDPKVPLFALLTRWAYRINVHRNDSLIVQQNWFADAMSELLGVPREKFRVIPPVASAPSGTNEARFFSPTDPATLSAEMECMIADGARNFLFASTADCHKNFETLCEAARRLEAAGKTDGMKVIITVKGDENRYARWLRKRWGSVACIDWRGLLPKDELFAAYAAADCFVFPSRIETWGLPISEYMQTNPAGKLLLADLPYAHETSGK